VVQIDRTWKLVPRNPRASPARGQRGLSLDAVFVLGHLFLGEQAPVCLAAAADAADNGGIEISDVIYLLGPLFLGTPPPPPPFTGLGRDPTTDDLDCIGF
jgi:hypothetical protein